MRLKGNTLATAATYAYSDPLKPDHAPSALTTDGVTTTFTYDANGNMLTGLGGKIMEYDGENRPLSVTYLGKKTCYVYGVDGKRLKKVEGLSPATLCTALPPAANVTTYFGPVEVRNWLGAEQVLTYPQPSIKLTNGVATWLHFDQLGSVRAITDAAGVKVESAIYRPFGEQSEWLQPGTPAPETKGWIGERYDADAGLQYLNARYYDPALGLFLQPDWFEVTKPGVGTNRFSYSFNDPVNKIDPGGNFGGPPSPEMLEKDKKKPKVKTELEKFTDWFFGNEETRTNRHLENAITEFGLAKDQYDTTLDPKDEMFLEHRRRAYAELGAIGQTSLDEAWNLVGEDFVEAALGGLTLGVGVLGPTKTVAVAPPMTAGDILAPGGSLVGTSMNFAKATERTVTKVEFDAIKDKLISIANPAKDPKKYAGAQYEFSPAGWMGVRNSKYGEALDFSIPGLDDFLKLHWK